MYSYATRRKNNARHAALPVRANRRKASGIVVGITNIAIVTPLVLAASFLLMDLGLTEYYREKAGFVLEQAGLYAMNLPEDAKIGPATHDMVSVLLRQSGLTVWNLKVHISKDSSAQGETMNISLSGQFPLIAGTNLPSVQTIQAAKAIPVATNQRFAQLAVNAFPYSNDLPERGPSVYIPLVRAGTNHAVWTFQQDESMQALHVVAGPAPALSAIGESNCSGLKSIY